MADQRKSEFIWYKDMAWNWSDDTVELSLSDQTKFKFFFCTATNVQKALEEIQKNL